MTVFMFLSLRHCTLDVFATGKHINHGDKYRLEIHANFHFCRPEKAIKLAKKYKIKNIEEILNENVNYCLK